MLLPITLTTAAGAALVHVWHFSRCLRLRIRHNISIGDGDNALMRTRMRAHANFAENAPIFLILLGLVELNSHASGWLWGAGLLFILSRLSHIFGMERPAPNALRAGGILTSIGLILALAVYAILLSYSA